MVFNKNGWKKISSKTVYNNRVLLVEDEILLPNGKESTYIYEGGEGGAAVLVVDSREVILTYQYRYPLKSKIYDLPGGGIKKDETPEAAAIRECQEECGITPKKLTRLLAYHTNPSRTAWPMYVFFSDDFEEYTELPPSDPLEQVEVRRLKFRQLDRLIEENKVVDPSLLLGWFLAKERGFID